MRRDIEWICSCGLCLFPWFVSGDFLANGNLLKAYHYDCECGLRYILEFELTDGGKLVHIKPICCSGVEKSVN